MSQSPEKLLTAWAAGNLPNARRAPGITLKGSDMAARLLVDALKHTCHGHVPVPGAAVVQAKELAPV